jgi:hypothetical protein
MPAGVFSMFGWKTTGRRAPEKPGAPCPVQFLDFPPRALNESRAFDTRRARESRGFSITLAKGTGPGLNRVLDVKAVENQVLSRLRA